MSAPSVHLRHERALLRSGARIVVGMDEVGRGALAGPVSVGAVAVDLRTRSCPPGVTDSKLLTPARREALLPALRRWGTARAVGHASAAEIDAIGIIAALRLAGMRALAALGVEVDVVLLDGSHDWLSPPAQRDLFELAGQPVLGPRGADPAAQSLGGGAHDAAGQHRTDALLGQTIGEPLAVGPLTGHGDPALQLPVPQVRTRVKADRSCASVAAASVLAKCERDAHMVELAARHPQYAWADNKGYGSPEHVAALAAHGLSPWHRSSWQLPGGANRSLADALAVGAGPDGT